MFSDFFSNPIWLLALTFSVYYGFTLLSRKIKSPLLNPVVFTSAFLIGYLLVLSISYQTFSKAGHIVEFWLKPSVVALAVPLYRQLENVKKLLLPLLVSQVLASLAGMVCVCWLAQFFGAPEEMLLSLAPKSVTTPIAVEVSSEIGGLPPVTVAAVMVTGMFGSMVGFQFLKLIGIKSPVAQGVAMGSASHGLGVMAAHGKSDKYAAFATVGLIFNGIATAVFAPYLVPFLVGIL